jgi:hypothetical protein
MNYLIRNFVLKIISLVNNFNADLISHIVRIFEVSHHAISRDGP